MVRGRLKRESNPTPGSRPGFTPQHDSTGSGDYVNTSPQNPLPVTDDSVEGRLQAIENKLDSVIENGAVNSQLTGRNVEKVVIGEEVNITAGGTNLIHQINDLSDYDEISLSVADVLGSANSHAFEVRVLFYSDGTTSSANWVDIKKTVEDSQNINLVREKIPLWGITRFFITNNDTIDHDYRVVLSKIPR